MPKPAATDVTSPAASSPATPWLIRLRARRRGIVGMGTVALAVATVASLLLLALPSHSVAGQQLPTYLPLAPAGDAHRTETGLALDDPFTVQFTKPMNEASVESALAITPTVQIRSSWDATSQALTIKPASHWEPFTLYRVDIDGIATDQEGFGLTPAIHTSFESGSPTAGTIAATLTAGSQAAPNTAFSLTFDRSVKLATVLTRFGISPQVDVTIKGDDPTDAASQVFTMTPKSVLAGNTTYQLSVADGGTDTSGATLQHVELVRVTTMALPAVVKFYPQDGTYTYDTNQPVSITFSTPMEHTSTEAAVKVTANGRVVAGTITWTQNDTVLVISPRSSMAVGTKVVASVSAAARSSTGMHITGAASVSFTVSKPAVRVISTGGGGGTSRPVSGGGEASASAPWHASEVYMFNLMNCTRTGGWVTSGGDCSTVTHHTRPAQRAMALSAGISSNVSRPYSQYMADRLILDHYADGSPKARLCNWGGYCGGAWGENIASPPSVGSGGMIAVEIWYQNESYQRGPNHYTNIMDPSFGDVGVGVWVSSSTGAIRVTIDFYS